MALLLSGCSTKPAEETGIYTPGTYNGSAEGFGGKLDVKVTLSANKIEKVEVTSHSETN